MRHYAELERRLLDIENSRFLRTLQWPGRFFGDWKGRLGQLLAAFSAASSLFEAGASSLYGGSLPADGWRANGRPPGRVVPRQPLISVILPVHNPRRDWLEAAVASVARPDLRLLATLCVRRCLRAGLGIRIFQRAEDDRAARPLRIRREHLGISGTLNRAGELARGEYSGFLDQDDVLAAHALACVAEAVEDSQPDLLYSDEDYLNADGQRVQPIFKPAFSPDLLRCGMYLGHLLVVRTARLRELGWFRTGYDGSQDYDLALRLAARPAVIRHIPRVLYHWRKHQDSTALNAAAKPYTQVAGFKALTEAVALRDPQAVVTPGASPTPIASTGPSPPI